MFMFINGAALERDGHVHLEAAAIAKRSLCVPAGEEEHGWGVLCEGASPGGNTGFSRHPKAAMRGGLPGIQSERDERTRDAMVSGCTIQFALLEGELSHASDPPVKR